jgi:hypothetical protein
MGGEQQAVLMYGPKVYKTPGEWMLLLGSTITTTTTTTTTTVTTTTTTSTDTEEELYELLKEKYSYMDVCYDNNIDWSECYIGKD